MNVTSCQSLMGFVGLKHVKLMKFIFDTMNEVFSTLILSVEKAQARYLLFYLTPLPIYFAMKEYDLLVIGGGAANKIALNARAHGLHVALVERDALLGTCVNTGCVPSKMLIHPADVIREAMEADAIDVFLKLKDVHFSQLMDRVRSRRNRVVTAKTRKIQEKDSFDFFEGEGVFVHDYQLQVNNEVLTAPQIVISTGARPLIPPIEGIEEVDFLTNKSLLELNEKPSKLIIIGGGYVGVEYGHFFSAIGTEVTIISRSGHLIENEDRDVCRLLKDELSKRMEIYLSHEASKLQSDGNLKEVTARHIETNDEIIVTGDAILMATGRIPNSDIVKPENTGVEMDKQGFIIADEYMRTSKEGIWATGDAIGNPMLKHVADEENRIAWENIKRAREGRGDFIAMNYSAVPVALFTRPEIARVGMTLKEAQKEYDDIITGMEKYSNVVMGEAMGEPAGFCRIIVDRKTEKILGATIIGSHAAILMQSIINVMYATDKNYRRLKEAIYIHPSLSKIIRKTASNVG